MAIPEAQLETWAHQGAVATSSTTYQTIRNALLAQGTAYAGKDVDVFLQGSHGNDTNVWAESDVDVVTFVSAYNWLINADSTQFVCANEQYYLLRDGAPVTWPPANGQHFLTKLAEFWKDWT